MRIAFFPYDKTMDCILTNISKQYCVQKLISPMGWGYVGETVETNSGTLMVEKDLGTEKEIDCIGFVNSIFPVNFDSTILPYLQICKQHHFKVLWFRECGKDIREKIREMIPPEDLFMIPTEIVEKNNNHMQGLYDINTPIIFVADAFPHQDSFYTQWLIHNEMRKRGYSVKLIGSKPEQSMMDGVLSVPRSGLNNDDIAEYILKFNHLLKSVEVYENPDVFVVGIPGNLLEMSKKIQGDFGKYAFLLTRSAFPDYVVCNIPYCVNIRERYVEIIKSVEKSTGWKVDAFAVFPQYLDLMLSEETDRFEYISLSKEFMEREMKSNAILYGVYDEIEVCRLVDSIIEQLSDYAFNNSI